MYTTACRHAGPQSAAGSTLQCAHAHAVWSLSTIRPQSLETQMESREKPRLTKEQSNHYPHRGAAQGLLFQGRLADSAHNAHVSNQVMISCAGGGC